MAHAIVCDRCWTPLRPDEVPHRLELSFLKEGHQVYAIAGEHADNKIELCDDCAVVVLNLIKKMKLGPDKVSGGVRKGKRARQVPIKGTKEKGK